MKIRDFFELREPARHWGLPRKIGWAVIFYLIFAATVLVFLTSRGANFTLITSFLSLPVWLGCAWAAWKLAGKIAR